MADTEGLSLVGGVGWCAVAGGVFAAVVALGAPAAAGTASVPAGPGPGGEWVEAFRIDRTEVSVHQYADYARRVGAAVPDQPPWSGPDHPVVNVTWDEAREFCRWRGLDLPTGVQWERAAVGGRSSGRYPWGDNLDRAFANIEDADGPDRWEASSPVGSLEPSGYGLYDAIGNAWEWVLDRPGEDDGVRTLRGGAWYSCRNSASGVAARTYAAVDKRHFGFGFRCAGPEP